MKTIMARSNSQDFSSKRHFHWTRKVSNEDDETPTTFKSSSNNTSEDDKKENEREVAAPAQAQAQTPATKKKLQAVTVARLRSVLTVFGRNRSQLPHSLGHRVVGTLFGNRRGHVHFAFQKDPTSHPAFLIELATPISGLVREMASGLVRIALECDKEEEKKSVKLLEEPLWRTYCNGKKCGYATKRDCGPKECNILKAVEPISMGAGVLPGEGPETGSEGELMYMRAKFERVIGSRDSEAFYMMNPDSNGAPELSIYLLRV